MTIDPQNVIEELKNQVAELSYQIAVQAAAIKQLQAPPAVDGAETSA